MSQEFQIISSSRSLRAEFRPLHHRTLATCLDILEVPKRPRSNRFSHRGYAPYRADATQLYDWLECAKRNHRRLIRLHHPDRGGCHGRAAVLNAAWDRVQELLARRGIEYAS